MYKRRKKGPSPISGLRVTEYPRTTNKRRDKITLRGEVERTCEELAMSEDDVTSELLSEVSGELINHSEQRLRQTLQQSEGEKYQIKDNSNK